MVLRAIDETLRESYAKVEGTWAAVHDSSIGHDRLLQPCNPRFYCRKICMLVKSKVTA
jgi:hypothetical protein